MRKKKVFLLSPVLPTLMLLLFLGCGGGSGGGSDPAPVTTPKTLSVGINYVDTDLKLPSCDTIDAYFSVLDPDNFTIGVSENDIKVYLNANPNPVALEDFEWPASINMPNSIAIAMDYSKTITDDLKTKMEAAVIHFISLMDDTDAGQIIKFASFYDIINDEFTSIASELENAALTAPTDIGIETNIYDTLWIAIENASNHAASPAGRPAVILLTDGEQQLDATPGKTKDHTLDQTILYAIEKQVPIYTIGIGSKDTSDIERIADETNGLFFKVSEATDLSDIYAEISTIFKEQHRIRISNISPGADQKLEIVVTSGGLQGKNTTAFTLSCPQ
jgi:hypothetical protein